MAKSKDFFSTIVVPTVQEFLSNPRDIRRGMLAAIVLYHQSDYWLVDGGARFGKLPQLHKYLISKCAAFQVIRDVADASKHCILDKPQKEIPRQLSSAERIASSPGLFNAPFGSGVFNEAIEIVVTLNDEMSHPLAPAVRSVLLMWETELGPSCGD